MSLATGQRTAEAIDRQPIAARVAVTRKSVHERMAMGGYLRTYHRSEGNFPKVTHIVGFVYSNGLITEYNGDKWEVVAVEYDTQD